MGNCFKSTTPSQIDVEAQKPSQDVEAPEDPSPQPKDEDTSNKMFQAIKFVFKTKSCFNGMNFLVGSAFLILAFFYAETPCENSTIVFLLIHGTLQLSQFIIGSLKPDDFTLPILVFLDFVSFIWGAAVIFSAYPSWQSNSPTDYGYCPRTPLSIWRSTPLTFAWFLYLDVLLNFVGWCLLTRASNGLGSHPNLFHWVPMKIFICNLVIVKQNKS